MSVRISLCDVCCSVNVDFLELQAPFRVVFSMYGKQLSDTKAERITTITCKYSARCLMPIFRTQAADASQPWIFWLNIGWTWATPWHRVRHENGHRVPEVYGSSGTPRFPCCV
jgi:hypothetical protein